MRGRDRNWAVWLGLGIFAVPYLALSFALFGLMAQGHVTAVEAGVFWLICFGALFTLLSGGLGKYIALVASIFVWISGLTMVGARIGADSVGWAMTFTFGGALCIIALAARGGVFWGHVRARRLYSRGRGILGWEWVFVGREFARNHPLSEGFGAIWLVITWIALLGAGYTALAMSEEFWGLSWLTWLGAIFAELTFLALLLRWPVAYGMTLVLLVFTLPFSAPLLMYWVDGARPNLIYRWRFERMRAEVPA